MYALITLLGDTPADKYFVRHIFRTYQGFNHLFRLFDIRQYSARENDAEVTILDRFAMFALLFYEGVSQESLLERLAGTKNLVFMTSDLHYWSIFPDLIDARLLTPQQPFRLQKFLGKMRLFKPRQLSPPDNQYDRLFEMFDRLNIRHLITCYDCPELRQIQLQRPALNTYVINLHIDPAIFRDYGLQKEYDVIIYGSLSPAAYPFRNRMCRLLTESRQFNVLHLKIATNGLYDADICGEGLARKINQSWLGLVTTSTFDYLVGKYFEIPACRSVVLGNMNEQGRAIFGNNYVHVDDRMTDSEILNIVTEALADRCRLQEYADQMYDMMHTRYTLEENERKLFQVATQILESC
jgi:hypothetical protein